MVVICDSRKRITLPPAKPGEAYELENKGGGTFHLTLLVKPGMEICPKCDGFGGLQENDTWRKCPNCHGKGVSEKSATKPGTGKPVQGDKAPEGK